MHPQRGTSEHPPPRSQRHGGGDALASEPGLDPGSPLAPVWRWRRVFPGHQRELAQLRRWLSALLPECPARDDVLSVTTELGSNALQNSASGQDGGWFAVEVTWRQSVVQVAVADCGGPAEPKVINDPDGERGRGLLLVHGTSLRTGWTGDRRGRLVWAVHSDLVGSRGPRRAGIRTDRAGTGRAAPPSARHPEPSHLVGH